MKKFFTSAVAKITFYVLLAVLLFAVMTGASSLLRVVAAAYWVIVLLGAIVGLLALVITFGVEYSKDEKSRREGIEYLKRFAKRKNAIARVWGWFCLVLGASLLAYGGWVFTAVAYVIASLFVRLCCSLARDKVEKLTEKRRPDVSLKY
ncbi:hypothetical protein L6R44_20955 [Enterobacter cloacae complex sp. ECC445]|uniref:hypothetical protein n=1 Tax=Enterobacter cloacae complex sp. ECC445 TaxID=2913213 RepID=UPI001F1DE82C|nr:hypothetical protein [Enterobacter cloacae complex sp. ECC445]MCG0458535.1 hypothetical protein [Enterobacter cloacae complex sp. ECC445]